MESQPLTPSPKSACPVGGEKEQGFWAKPGMSPSTSTVNNIQHGVVRLVASPFGGGRKGALITYQFS